MTTPRNAGIALSRLLASCWADNPIDAFDLYSWHQFYQKAEFATDDGTCALVLDNEIDTPGVRVRLQDTARGPAAEWLLVLDDQAVLAIERGDADVLANEAWRMLRLVSEGTATAAATDHPADWHEARAKWNGTASGAPSGIDAQV